MLEKEIREYRQARESLAEKSMVSLFLFYFLICLCTFILSSA